MISASVLKNDEKAIFRLRELYSKYGYSRYKVSKFEEYDLYAHNKSFLVSENVLTFTDTDGRLMALKPDVTLSIVKNIAANGNETQKGKQSKKTSFHFIHLSILFQAYSTRAW